MSQTTIETREASHAGTQVGEQRLLECVGLVKDYPGKRAVDGVRG